MIIKIDITKKHPTVDGTPVLVCGNGTYEIQFTFDTEWREHIYKTARFVFWKDGKPKHIDVPFPGDTVAVPVLSGISFVLVGVYAGNLRTTTPARIPCEYSIRCNSGESVEEPTPELYDQLLDLYNRVGLYQEEAIQSAETATKAKEDAQEAAVVAKEAIGSVVSKVIEGNATRWVSFWVGTQAEYDAIEEKVENCMYIITDDKTPDEVMAEIQGIAARAEAAAAAAEATAAAAAATKAAAEWGSLVFADSDGVDKTVKMYGNGLAEGWYKVRAQGVVFSVAAGGLYLTPKLKLPYPDWLTDSLYYDAPIFCEVSVIGTSDANIPVTLLSSGFRDATHTQNFYLASTQEATVDVDLFAHFVWWWKEESNNPAAVAGDGEE